MELLGLIYVFNKNRQTDGKTGRQTDTLKADRQIKRQAEKD